MKQFEYQTIKNNTILEEPLLNKLGQIGWELISFTIGSQFYTYIFKREIEKLILGNHGAH